MGVVEGMSADDLDAYLARQSDDARRWAEEYRRLKPDLWFVLRHSGRSGERWRVIFQSRSKEEAEAVYLRKAYPRNRPDITYAATALYEGGLTWDCRRRRCGDAPLDGSVPVHVDGQVKTARDREEREVRRARRQRRRVAVPHRVPEVGMRIAPAVDVGDEHEAVAVEQVMARAP